MELQAKSILGSPRQMKQLIDIAKEQLKAHSDRATGLLSILK